MGTKSRDEAKLETREALIDAGIALFGEEGLDAPSLDAICERAGYTRGAFYVHFATRDAFLEAVMEKVGQRFLDAVLGPTDDDLGALAARFMRAVATGDYPLMRSNAKKPGVRPHQLLDACVRSPAIRARYVALATESTARMARVVGRGQKDGLVRGDVDAGAVATILLAAIIGAQTMRELRMPLDLPGTSAALLRLLTVEPKARRR
jgi:TetR/AcrR family transcriptional repressor of nem operon